MNEKLNEMKKPDLSILALNKHRRIFTVASLPSVTVSPAGDSLVLEDSDGRRETFSSVWLRDCSDHPETRDPVSLGRTLLLKDLDTDIKIEKVN